MVIDVYVIMKEREEMDGKSKIQKETTFNCAGGGTDPTSRDTDQDGISDPDEVRDNSCGGYFMRGIDRDEDGTPDGPLDWDSDGDGHVPSKNHPKPYIS